MDLESDYAKAVRGRPTGTHIFRDIRTVDLTVRIDFGRPNQYYYGGKIKSKRTIAHVRQQFAVSLIPPPSQKKRKQNADHRVISLGPDKVELQLLSNNSEKTSPTSGRLESLIVLDRRWGITERALLCVERQISSCYPCIEISFGTSSRTLSTIST